MVAVLAIGGCGSPFAGRWKAEDFTPADRLSRGVVKLTIHDDGAFMAVYESYDGTILRGATGDWDKESDRKIRLFVREGDGPPATAAELTKGKRLMLIGRGFATEFKRD